MQTHLVFLSQLIKQNPKNPSFLDDSKLQVK